MIFLVAGCFVLLAAVIAWQLYAAVVERDKFDQERQRWTDERRELLTRIQAPEAAPFMFEPDEEDRKNDLPIPPTTMDQEEYDKAVAELQDVGYEDLGTGL